MSGALLPLSLGAAGVSRTRRHRRRPCVAAASTVATDAASGTDSGDDDELDLEMLDELLALRRQRDERESVQESTIGNGIARLIFENLREVRALSVAPRQGRGGRAEHRRRLPRRREVSPVSLPPLTPPAGAFRRKIGGRSERRGARSGWSGGAPLLPPREAAKGGSLRVAVPLGDHSLPPIHLQLGAEHGQEVRLAQQLRVPAGVRHGAPRRAPRKPPPPRACQKRRSPPPLPHRRAPWPAATSCAWSPPRWRTRRERRRRGQPRCPAACARWTDAGWRRRCSARPRSPRPGPPPSPPHPPRRAWPCPPPRPCPPPSHHPPPC